MNPNPRETEAREQAPPVFATTRSRPFRVCHVAYTFYETDNRVIRYAETLAERGDHVDVIALRRHGQARVGCCKGVRLFRIQRRARTEKRALMYLIKILWFFAQAAILLTLRHVRKPYNVVHVHNVPDFLVFTAFIPRLTGCRIVLDIHDILPEFYSDKFGAPQSSLQFRLLLLLERASCWFADHVIVSNDIWRDKLRDRAIPARKVTTMLNSPDLRVFKPLPPDRKVQDEKFIFLYPGTLNYHQGVEIAVRAFARMKDRMPKAEFHIYGEGPSRPDLMRLARERGLSDSIRIMDPVPLTEISQLMASADAGVIPKRADGFGNEAFSTKILEFMACGVPVIVPRTRIDSYYFNDRLVRFFTPGDEADLAETLFSAYSDRGRVSEMTTAALDFAVRRSWQVHAAEYQGLIDALVQGPARAREEELAASAHRSAASGVSRPGAGVGGK